MMGEATLEVNGPSVSIGPALCPSPFIRTRKGDVLGVCFAARPPYGDVFSTAPERDNASLGLDYSGNEAALVVVADRVARLLERSARCIYHAIQRDGDCGWPDR